MQSVDAQYWYELGNSHARQGRFSDAVQAYQRALELNPDFGASANNLANALRLIGDIDKAILWFRKAISVTPDLEQAYLGLSDSLGSRGDLAGAIECLDSALKINPKSVPLRIKLADYLYGAGSPLACLVEQDTLIDLLNFEDIAPQNLAVPVAELLEALPTVKTFANALKEAGDVDNLSPYASLFEHPLLMSALPRVVFQSKTIELILTVIRRHVTLEKDLFLKIPLPFLCALAQHCFFNEYSWLVSPEEKASLSAVLASINNFFSGNLVDFSDLERTLLLAALYQPLVALVPDIDVMKNRWSASFRPVFNKQVVDVLHERELAAGIQTAVPIADEVSCIVQQQYEQNPYPRWISCQRAMPETMEQLSARLRPGVHIPKVPRPYPVLVAGCGTGQHSVKAAQRSQEGMVTAVDISRASLGYAAMMAERYNLDNIRFLQCDILELEQLGEKYEIIECGGVLHHMRQPIDGWRVLVNIMADDGLLYIGLYSKHARRDIWAAREFIKEQGFGNSPDEIRLCRQAIMNLPDNHPAKSVMYSSDFWSISGCRDLLMHAQEHVFTLEEIAAHLKELGLRFLGFETHPEVLGDFRNRYPQPGSLTNLELWDLYEREHPYIFGGMYQFWCSR